MLGRLWSSLHSTLSTLSWGKPVPTHSSPADSRLPKAFLLVTVVLQSVKCALLPCIEPQGQGTKSVAPIAPSPVWVSAHVITPFLRVPTQGHRSYLITSLSFLLDCLWIFLTALIVQECVYQFPVFSKNCYTCKCIFDVFVRGGEFHVLLLHYLDQSLLEHLHSNNLHLTFYIIMVMQFNFLNIILPRKHNYN